MMDSTALYPHVCTMSFPDVICIEKNYKGVEQNVSAHLSLDRKVIFF